MAAGRKTGGRQKGTRNKATEALEAAAKAAIAGLPTDVTSLILMQSVYRNGDLPFPVRMKAAEIAMPYEHPKLSAIEHTGKDGGPIAAVSVDPKSLTKEDLEALDAIADRATRPPVES